jgi:dihydropyrimidinase
VHLAQDNSPTGDSWETGTRSAIAGGTTTVIAFASQKKSEESLFPVVQEYHRRSEGNAYCDYGFHVIVSNPTEGIFKNELAALMQMGVTSLKLYMTYPLLKLGDADMMELLIHTRGLGMTTMVHAENADMIDV